MRIGLWTGIVAAASCNATPLVNPTGDTGTTSTGLDRVNTILSLSPIWQNGSDEYTQQCLVCHPSDGGIGPNGEPALNEIVPIRTNVQLVTVLIAGITSSSGTLLMPAYDEYFTNQQMADLLAYMRVSFTPPYVR